MIFKGSNKQLNIINKKMAIHLCFAIFSFLNCILLFHHENVQGQNVGPYDLISLINGMRSSNGLGALSIDSALMACAQSTAETMAASNMTWHIGNVSGRASSFGYNNYNTCFATENFTMGSASMSISEVAASWADATHMIPATNSKYCHIGAGVAAAANGLYYFVVQAAYPAGSNGCGYASGNGNSSTGTQLNPVGGTGAASAIIRSVITATPNEDGYVIHTVDEGQTLWAISQAYDVTVEDIQSWNHLYNSTALSLGQELLIPSKEQSGRTPTPQIELTVFPTANSSGKFFHIVREGDTLWSISELWNVSLNSIYQANGMNENSSIGLGWEIAIPVTATITPLPTYTATMTEEPTETSAPAENLSEATESIQTTITATQDNRLLHIPETNTKTYVIISVFVMIVLGGGIVALNTFGKKK